MKDCSRCKKTLDESLFPKTGQQCQACLTAYHRAYRQTETYRQIKARYRNSEKGRVTERAREERPDVLEKRRIASASPQGRVNKAKYEATPKGKETRRRAILNYRQSDHGKAISKQRDAQRKFNPAWIEKKKVYDRRYRASEKGKAVHTAMTERRRARIKGTVSGKLTAAEWLAILKSNRYRCFYCKQKIRLTMDHVIPLSKGGEHRKENIVPACASCNSRKHDRLVMLL